MFDLTLRKLVLSFCFWASFLFMSTPIFAQTDRVESSADYAFGQVLNFSLLLDDAANVESATASGAFYDGDILVAASK
jgi:hypothetical protein